MLRVVDADVLRELVFACHTFTHVDLVSGESVQFGGDLGDVCIISYLGNKQIAREVTCCHEKTIYFAHFPHDRLCEISGIQ